MKSQIPPLSSIRQALRELNTAQVRRLADKTKIPFTTLWKIRSGETKNPGVETVRLFIAALGAPSKELIHAKKGK